MKQYRILSLLTAVVLTASATACGGQKESEGEAADMEQTTAATEATEATEAWEPADESLGLPSLGYGLVTEEMLRRAVLSEGNTQRLAAAMKKAENGERVVVGTIGGSITQGSSASSSNEAYAMRTLQWWTTAFPDASIDFVNAGIGATGSYIGVHRVEQDLLSKNPDVVVVEFSVNDTNAEQNRVTYDSLVRKILSSENQPAVILLFTTQEDGTSLQDVHREIGAAYDLPMISYKDAILPEIEAGSFKWTDISPDNIHPNTDGHRMISEILWAYFNSVYAKLDTLDTAVSAFDIPACTDDRYANAVLYDSSNLTPTEMEGFAPQQVFSAFPNDWKTTEPGSITFEVEGSNIGLMYYKTVDGLSGQYCVSVDGKLQTILDADFTGGWGNYAEAAEIYTSDTPAKHTVTISMLEGTDLSQFAILGLLVS